MYLKRPLNWLKNKITKIEESLNETADLVQSKTKDVRELS